MRAFVSGGAGFIGSHLVPHLLGAGHAVTVYDDLSLGRREQLRACEGAPKFRFVKGDLCDRERLVEALAGHDTVFHLAANSDIREGTVRTDLDLRLGTLACYEVLEAMRGVGAERIVFASSSVVYGEARVQPTPEDHGPLQPISLYGASKLACEGLLSAFQHQYGIRAWIYRLANVVGARATHGVVLDFLRKLAKDPTRLEVLGDGRQAKPYLYVDDCIDGMLFGLEHAGVEGLHVFNLTSEGATPVRAIAEIVCEELGLADVEVRCERGPRGWRGDVPQVRMDPGRMARLGFRPRLGSEQAVRQAVRDLLRERAEGLA